MFAAEPRHLEAFVLCWFACAAVATLALVRVKTPFTKWWLTRAVGIVAGIGLLGGVWWFATSASTLVFGALGIGTVAVINFYSIRVCPHCAKTIYPRRQLALGFCPRCKANLAGRHERIASWRGIA